MRRIDRSFLLVILLALFASFRGADARAEERILALAPHVAEILYAVGAGDSIVGAVRYCDYPPAAAALPVVGGYKAISVEAALRTRPTLAIALDASVEGVERLAALGVRVAYAHPQTVREALQDIERIGRLAGRAAEAQALAASLRERLKRLARRRPAQPVRTFYELWHRPLTTAGASSFLSDALREVGAENVFGDLNLPNPRVSVEAVLRAQPEVIVIPSEARDVAERAQSWRQWFGAAEPRFVAAHHDLLHRPGPRLLDGMEALQTALLAERRQP